MPAYGRISEPETPAALAVMPISVMRIIALPFVVVRYNLAWATDICQVEMRILGNEFITMVKVQIGH